MFLLLFLSRLFSRRLFFRLHCLFFFHLQHFIGKTPLATRETQCLRIHHVRTMSGSGGRRHQMNQDNQESQGTAEDKNIQYTVAQRKTTPRHKKQEKKEKTVRNWLDIDLSLFHYTSFVSKHLANRTQLRANQPSTGGRICIGGFASLKFSETTLNWKVERERKIPILCSIHVPWETHVTFIFWVVIFLPHL